MNSLIPLRRPLRGLTHLRHFDPYLSDLAALVVGVKPVLQMDCTPDDGAYIRQLCRAFGFKYRLLESPLPGVCFQPDKQIVFLGKDLGSLSRAAALWPKRESRSLECGRLLGYPDCCIHAFRDSQARRGEGRPPPDLIRRTYANSRGGTAFSFMLNNVANHTSRVDAHSLADSRCFAALRRVNAVGLAASALQVISWHPCAYTCPASLEKARQVFSFLETDLPEWSRLLRAHLAHPVLYIGKYEYVFFEGRVSPPATIAYGRVLAPRSLLSGETLRAIQGGREVRIRGKGIRVEPGGVELKARRGAPIILDFRDIP